MLLFCFLYYLGHIKGTWKKRKTYVLPFPVAAIRVEEALGFLRIKSVQIVHTLTLNLFFDYLRVDSFSNSSDPTNNNELLQVTEWLQAQAIK